MNKTLKDRKIEVYCEDGWIVLSRRTHDTDFF